MINSKSLILLFCIQAFLASISIPIGQSRTLFPNDDNLITQTCQKTYDPNVCVQTLKCSNADVKGLALIMIDAMKAHGNDVVNKINELLKGSPSPGQRDSLHYCASMYAEILNPGYS
ncbi:hypothetical protein L6164_011949 [Bauhinia variegata]|uniref:Uncharacterized protein n=1 Tax=Bauhinia variegata TaxID=167791 RepID=A0ACB9P8J9_BAUVA|nr:hypothetical protein L6164_011949 [Bauhinia variegata]